MEPVANSVSREATALELLASAFRNSQIKVPESELEKAKASEAFPAVASSRSSSIDGLGEHLIVGFPEDCTAIEPTNESLASFIKDILLTFPQYQALSIECNFGSKLRNRPHCHIHVRVFDKDISGKLPESPYTFPKIANRDSELLLSLHRSTLELPVFLGESSIEFKDTKSGEVKSTIYSTRICIAEGGAAQFVHYDEGLESLIGKFLEDATKDYHVADADKDYPDVCRVSGQEVFRKPLEGAHELEEAPAVNARLLIERSQMGELCLQFMVPNGDFPRSVDPFFEIEAV